MLYKRSKKAGAHWWVRFSTGGIEVRQSSGTDRKELAEQFEQQLREAIWNEQNLGIEVHTWAEACARWNREKAHKRSIKRDAQAFARLAIPGPTDIAEVFGLVSAADGRLSKCGLRERATLRSVLNACVTWGWLDRAPKVVMPHAEKHDPRWITKEQFEKLATELPPHAREIAIFAVSTGLRRANVFRLRWDAVNIDEARLYVASTDAKGKKAIGIPLATEAVKCLRRQRHAGHHSIYVFTDDHGRAPIGSLKTCWLAAVKRAGLEGFRFHDLRHTWAAWHTLAGTPPIVLKTLGGWSSITLVERYAHLNPSDVADWADNSMQKTHRRMVSKGKKR